jgi:hypothetical protein
MARCRDLQAQGWVKPCKRPVWPPTGWRCRNWLRVKPPKHGPEDFKHENQKSTLGGYDPDCSHRAGFGGTSSPAAGQRKDTPAAAQPGSQQHRSGLRHESAHESRVHSLDEEVRCPRLTARAESALASRATRGYAVQTMFETVKAEIATVSQKLTHLRRFL